MKLTRTVEEVGKESQEEEFSENEDESESRAPVCYTPRQSRRLFACASE